MRRYLLLLMAVTVFSPPVVFATGEAVPPLIDEPAVGSDVPSAVQMRDEWLQSTDAFVGDASDSVPPSTQVLQGFGQWDAGHTVGLAPESLHSTVGLAPQTLHEISAMLRSTPALGVLSEHLPAPTDDATVADIAPEDQPPAPSPSEVALSHASVPAIPATQHESASTLIGITPRLPQEIGRPVYPVESPAP